MRFLSYLVTLLVAVFITACGGGGGSAGAINPGSSDALRTDVPAGLSFVVSEAKSFTIAGGKAPYSVISNHEGVAVAGVDGSTLTIGGVFPGTAELTVRDALGQTVKANVTITENGLVLATTAPSVLTMAMGQQLSYPVGGGIAPYAVTSANPNIVAASISGRTLTLTGITPGGPVNVTIRDSLNAVVSIAVTVTPVGGLALFTTAPTPLTVPIGAAPVFSVGGGVSPYLASSSNPAIATVAIAGNTMTITGIAGGSASITVRDAQNNLKTIDVTVPPLAAVFTTAPAGLTIGIGSAPTFTIGGGTGTGYKATSSNEAVAVAAVSGTDLKITALKSGSASIVVRDSAGNSATVAVTVPAPTPLFTTAPSPITIAVGSMPTFTVSGGTLPYSPATTSNAAVATATLSGTTLEIVGVSAGSAVIQVHDSVGTVVSISVTVASSSSSIALFTSAPSTVTLPISATPVVYSVGGGTGPYTATSSNPSVLSVVSPVSGGNLNVTALSAGPATVVIHDALGASVSFNVTVTGTSVLPLFTTAPPNIVMNVGTPRTFTVGGGTAPFLLTSSNSGIVTVTPATTAATSTASMTLTPVAAGSATIQVVDSAGAVVTVGVTVSSSSTVPLFTTAPSTLSIEINTDQVYTIGGGTAPYSASTNSNPSVASATITNTTTLTIHASLIGSTNITVFDSAGASKVLAVTVIPKATTLSLLPESLTIDEKTNSAIVFTISGGTGPYTAFSSNNALAPVPGGSFVGSQLTVGAVVSRCVAANTPVTLTIVDSLGAVKTSTLNIVDTSVTCP